MLEQYRKTLIPMQIGIFAVCAFLLFRHVPLLAVLYFFLVMQLGAVLGAWWGARIRRKVRAARGELPLSRQ